MSGKEISAQSSVKTAEQGPFGHSKASARYDSGRTMPLDAYDRTWLLLEWVGTNKRVLEVGCSTGYMSRLMAARNCIVTGIEIDPKAAECARAHCRDVHVRDLNAPDWTLGLPTGAFDVVLFGDVLEHLIDPTGALHGIKEFLASDGAVVISLPNVVHWVTRLKLLCGQFNYESWGTLDHTHLRFYTVKTARELIENAGYRITRFHPAFGGSLSGYARPIWQLLARWFPGIFAFQLLYEAKPHDGNCPVQIC